MMFLSWQSEEAVHFSARACQLLTIILSIEVLCLAHEDVGRILLGRDGSLVLLYTRDGGGRQKIVIIARR
jgi:hypothetical protein